MTKKEEKELFRLYKQGNRLAYNKIILANQGFVKKVALQYKNQGVEVDDLMAVGTIGLVRAIDDFEVKRNLKFISYAVWRIRQAILTEIASQSRFMKITGPEGTKVHRVNKVIQILEQELGRPPISKEITAKYSKVYPKDSVTAERLKKLDILNNITSLSAPRGENGSTNLQETIIDTKTPPPDDVGHNEKEEKLMNFLASANLRNVRGISGLDVIQMYFGIGYAKTHTLDEIGTKYERTRERIRQLMKECINVIKKHNTRQQQMGEFHLDPNMFGKM